MRKTDSRMDAPKKRVTYGHGVDTPIHYSPQTLARHGIVTPPKKNLTGMDRAKELMSAGIPIISKGKRYG